MGARETKVYVLKPYKVSAKRKSSSQIPTSKEMLDKPLERQSANPVAAGIRSIAKKTATSR
jgi:hypothetical protein